MSLTNKKRKIDDDKKYKNINSIICIKDTIDSDKIVTMSLNRTLNCWDGHSFKFQNSIKVNINSFKNNFFFYQIDCNDKALQVPVSFELCNEGSKLWAFIPTDNIIKIKNVCETKEKKNELYLQKNKTLEGHFQPISALAYRQNYQEVNKKN